VPRPKTAPQRAVASSPAFVRPDSQRLRNFASVARLLALARRRKADPWHLAFRAGATYNALQELNASGEISAGQYRIIDAWIFWGEPETKKSKPVKSLGRSWWREKNAKDEKPASAPAAEKTAGPTVHRDQRRGTATAHAAAVRGRARGKNRGRHQRGAQKGHVQEITPFKKGRRELMSAQSVAAVISRVRPRAAFWKKKV